MSAYVKSMLCCEQVILDEFTKKYSLLNLVNRFAVPIMPCPLPPFACHAVVSDVKGDFKTKFVLLDPELNTIGEVGFSGTPTDRTAENDFTAHFHRFVVSQFGTYTINLTLNGEIVGTTTFKVSQMMADGLLWAPDRG